MKLKYIWEKGDLKCGRYIIRESCPMGSTNTSFAASVCYKLGWPVFRVNKDESLREAIKKRGLCTIAVNDGMVALYESEDELLKMLNEDTHGYRPLTQKELIQIMNFLEPQNIGE